METMKINLYIAQLSESEFVTHIITTLPSGLETWKFQER